MNKVLLTSAIAVANLVTVPAFSKSGFDGFYVGASAGYSSLEGGEKITIDNPTPDGYVTASPALKSNNIIGTLHLGYAQALSNNFHLGIEYAFSFDNHETKYNFSTGGRDGSHVQTKLRKKFTNSIYLLPGYKIQESLLLQAKLGFSLARLNYKAEDNYTESGSPESFLGFKKTTTLPGYSIGAGVKFALSEQFCMRLDIDYTKFRDFEAHYRKSSTHSFDTKLKPEITTLTVGFNYNF